MHISISSLAIGFSIAMSLWSISFWYLFRSEKKFLDIIDNTSTLITAIIAICLPLIAVWFSVNRRQRWSLD